MLNKNEWHYYTLSISDAGRTVIMAVDGVILLKQTLAAPIKFNNPNFNLTIGQSAWLGGYAFCGLLDEVRVYDYGMSQKQISDDYKVNNYIIKADINADNKIDIRDLVCAKKYLSGISKYVCIANLDIDANFKLDVVDLAAIRKTLLEAIK